MRLSRELARRGHEVCHVFFADNTSTPKGQLRHSADPRTLTIEGLHIRRKFSKYSLFTRRQADLDYGRVTAARMNQFAPDVVLSANMPLDAQRILLEAAQRRNAKFIFSVQDVYSVAVRFVLERKAKFLAWAGAAYFERLEKKLLSKSDAIICIAPEFADLLTRWGLPKTKITVLENWAPLDEIVPTVKDNSWAREHDVSDKFCFMYSGTLGMKHSPQLLLELAKHLESRGDARLIVIASGAGADWLAANSGGVKPEVFTMLPFQPYERLSEVIGAADVLIALLDPEAGAFAVPSKSLTYLCARRAQIVAAPATNQVAKMVEKSNAGLVVSPGHAQELIAASDLLLTNSQLCSSLGQNARRYAEENFAISAIADKFLGVFEAQTRPAIDELRDVSSLR